MESLSVSDRVFKQHDTLSAGFTSILEFICRGITVFVMLFNVTAKL